jgi:hypothetical protein
MHGLKSIFKGMLVAALALAPLAGATTAGAAPTKAASGVTLCPGYENSTYGGLPKTDTVGDPRLVLVDAPSGFLIGGYCVKAGSGTTAAQIVTLNPPVASYWLYYPTGKAISHYSVWYVPTSDPGDAEWCSPGFWRNNAANWGAGAWPVPTTTLYNAVIDPDVAGNPSLLDVLNAPQIYGGAAFNAAATYLSIQAGLNVTTPIVHNCTLTQQSVYPDYLNA